MTGFRITTSSDRMSLWVMWLRWSSCLGNLLRKSLVLNCPLDRGAYERTDALTKKQKQNLLNPSVGLLNSSSPCKASLPISLSHIFHFNFLASPRAVYEFVVA